jgi:hypothetical protein
MEYPGIGVMSTFAAPTLNSPLAAGCTGAGRVPAIPPHPISIARDMVQRRVLHGSIINPPFPLLQKQNK